MTPSEKLVSACAKAMCDRAELLWEALPEKPDMACGHGMPEGCRQYWYYLAQATIAIVVQKAAEVARAEKDNDPADWYDFGAGCDASADAILALSDRSREG